MSVSVPLAELAHMALGTADGSNAQAGALRVLLRGLLQHFCLQQPSATIGGDMAGVPEPPDSGTKVLPCTPHQQPRPAEGEGQQGPPSMVPAPSGAADRDCQMVQLRKRIEVTEEGMTKVTDMLHDVLTNISSLKNTVDGFQEDLQLLKDSFQKAGLEEVQEQFMQPDKQQQLKQSILDQLKHSGQEMGAKTSQELAHKALHRLSWMMEHREARETHVSCQESQPQQYADSETFEDVAVQQEKTPTEMRNLQDGEKWLDLGREVLGQVVQLQKQCTRLQEAAEQLCGDSKDTQKADEGLETKASQKELQHTMVQLTVMMQELLQKMSLLEQDRQKAMEKLLSEMDTKAQLEQTWRLSQPCPCQRHCCCANCAANYKRPLVTIRKSNQFLQSQPASTSSLNSLRWGLSQRENEGSSRASQGHTNAVGSQSTSLVTVCSCGEPVDFICNHREVDILGIDGVIYKGRLNSAAANRTVTMGKNFPVTKTPQPCSQPRTEKTRGVSKYGNLYVSPYSCAAIRTKMGSSRGQWQAAACGSRTSDV